MTERLDLTIIKLNIICVVDFPLFDSLKVKQVN